MTGITHHISEDLLARYAAGRLPHPFAVVVAAHVALCDDCRACVEARDMLGGGIRQQILSADGEGSLRLLYIPPGRAVPEHGHRGLELTLVLQGSFSDAVGHFGAGDVETAEDDIDHQPVAGPGPPCICLAATDAPLRFHALIPRLLQPLFRI